MQDDILFRYFTVREAFTFAARLKLKCSEALQDRRINDLIVELGLTECADTPIGDILKKTISGGERKRASIGVELITDPQILLLDEPTSGLDSFTAVKICMTLHNLAHKYGKTICATIHQPSSQALTYFDRLILMGDGHILFQGKPIDTPEYFETMGWKMNRYGNPADFFMKILTFKFPREDDDTARF